VPEVQAQLTNSPYDKEPFHKKQPAAIAGGEDIKRAEDSRDLLHEIAAAMSYLYFESSSHLATTDPTLKSLRPETVVETHPVAVIKHTILWTPNEFTPTKPETSSNHTRIKRSHATLLERMRNILH
jgi:hypothetical protein